MSLCAICIVLGCVACLILAAWTGKRARVYPAPPGESRAYLVGSAPELYRLVKSRGGRGRILVHFGSHLHFNSIDDPAVYHASGAYPLTLRNPQREYEARTDYTNFLWVAMEGNVARTVHAVLPPKVYREKVAELRAEGYHFLEEHDGYFRDGTSGLVRTIGCTLPTYSEPVLINVDASYLDAVDPAAFAQVLAQWRPRWDLITFSLAQDSPDVTEAQRQKLLALAARFQAARPASVPTAEERRR